MAGRRSAAGAWASDTPVAAPAAQPGDKGNYHMPKVRDDRARRDRSGASRPFDGTGLGADWEWVRPPAAGTYSVGGWLVLDGHAGSRPVRELNNASVLTQAAQRG